MESFDFLMRGSDAKPAADAERARRAVTMSGAIQRRGAMAYYYIVADKLAIL